MAIGDVFKIKLENIASGGEAFGRLSGKPVFIQGGAPDETVLCRTIEERKTWIKADLLEIIEASRVRVDSVCAFYGKCGGCNLQHIEYNAQLEIKASILRNSFLRIGGFNPPAFQIFPSPPFGYRNRMQFHCLREQAKEENQKFGLKEQKSEKIIAVTDCPVADKGIRKLLQEAGKLPLPPEKDRFTVFSCNELFLSEGGVETGKIKLLGKEVFFDVRVFFQSNIVMLEKLILELQKIAADADLSLPMADFYCGVGTFAVFLGEMFSKAVLAEENKKAISLARENLKGKNVEFFALRDNVWQETIIKKASAHQKFGFAVVDPPRTGLNGKLAAALAREGPPLLAYVSCNAAALARDSKILTNGGYKLKELKFFDFYPQTAHIETLAVFVK
ncbi:MAG: methyltransferase [Treponema sp.]|jgi:23S rRNA (uracil1939-C5)-methyltransferase|nr:methyltransferase [Treponema sp.]